MLHVVCAAGLAVQDLFQVMCDHWYDEDFPDDPNIRLWYSAWYRIPEGDADEVINIMRPLNTLLLS